MRKSSWIVLGLCVLLTFVLGGAYLLTRPTDDALTQARVEAIVRNMQTAVAKRNVNGIMDYIAPGSEPRIANMRPEQLRLLMVRAFREAGALKADCQNIALQPGNNEGTIDFDLTVMHTGPGFESEAYKGHITLKVQKVEVPQLFGLYKTKEWRIVEASTTGRDPSNFGE